MGFHREGAPREQRPLLCTTCPWGHLAGSTVLLERKDQHRWDSDLACPEGTPCLSNDTGPLLLKKTKKSLISFPGQRGPNLKAQWGMNDPGPELLCPGKGHCSWQAGVDRTEATPGQTEHSCASKQGQGLSPRFLEALPHNPMVLLSLKCPPPKVQEHMDSGKNHRIIEYPELQGTHRDH